MLTSLELRDLLASWLSISIAFAIASEPSNPIGLLPIYLLVVGTAFILHELAHKYSAIRLGYHAEYRLWTAGLALAVLLAFTMGIVFAAPGAVYVLGYPSRRDDGIISVAGPLANFLVATFALLAIFLLHPSYFLLGVLLAIFKVNTFIGLFNMLPIPPLDGSKVLTWSLTAYIALISLLLFYFFFPWSHIIL